MLFLQMVPCKNRFPVDFRGISTRRLKEESGKILVTLLNGMGEIIGVINYAPKKRKK